MKNLAGNRRSAPPPKRTRTRSHVENPHYDRRCIYVPIINPPQESGYGGVCFWAGVFYGWYGVLVKGYILCIFVGYTLNYFGYAFYIIE